MEPIHYPVVNERNIPLILSLYEANSEYFNNPECPYTETTKSLFMGTAKVFDMLSHNDTIKPMDDDETIVQINTVYNQLMVYGADAQKSDNTTDKNTYFRVATSLLEKLVSIKEKMSNLKNVNLFISSVLQIMDEVLTTDQRAVVMERLKEFKEKL